MNEEEGLGDQVTATRREEGVITDWHVPQRNSFFTNIWESNGKETERSKEYIKTIF